MNSISRQDIMDWWYLITIDGDGDPTARRLESLSYEQILRLIDILSMRRDMILERWDLE